MTVAVETNFDQSHIDQALEIIRNSNDGDDLSPSDLSLVQLVVNSSLASLSDVGRARWDKLISDTRSGVYQQAWFHGVENLLRNGDGYVKWRGRVVEHYSFPCERSAQEKVSAKRLGAICRRLERDGIEPRGGEVMAMYHRLRTGGELGASIPRYAVTLLLNRSDRIDMRVKPLTATTDLEIVAEGNAMLEEVKQASAHRGDHADRPSLMLVVTQDDYDNVVAAVTGHVAWARRVCGASWSEVFGDEPQKSLATLEALCPRASLASPEQIELVYLGESFPEPDEEPARLSERQGG